MCMLTPKVLAVFVCSVALAQSPRAALDRLACLFLEKDGPLRCRSTQSKIPSEVKFARAAKIGDKWLQNELDDRISVIMEAESIVMYGDPVTTYELRGDAMVRTPKSIARAERLSFTDEEFRRLLSPRRSTSK